MRGSGGGMEIVWGWNNLCNGVNFIFVFLWNKCLIVLESYLLLGYVKICLCAWKVMYRELGHNNVINGTGGGD